MTPKDFWQKLARQYDELQLLIMWRSLKHMAFAILGAYSASTSRGFTHSKPYPARGLPHLANSDSYRGINRVQGGLIGCCVRNCSVVMAGISTCVGMRRLSAFGVSPDGQCHSLLTCSMSIPVSRNGLHVLGSSHSLTSCRSLARSRSDRLRPAVPRQGRLLCQAAKQQARVSHRAPSFRQSS